MKLAVISDIHGNLPALETVLKDAKSNCVDNYIFAGDYCLSNPYPNECIQAIRDLDNKYVIRGNEEKYLENLIDKDQVRRYQTSFCSWHMGKRLSIVEKRTNKNKLATKTEKGI